MTDWVTISSLATAGGTLVLAVATFSSVRSANRTARAAERSLEVGLRPVLIPSREDDPSERVMFGDQHRITIDGHGGVLEVADGRLYLGVGLRNAGAGLAVIHGWRAAPYARGTPHVRPEPDDFRRQERDLYIPVGERGFWQGAIRDPADELYAPLRDAIDTKERIMVDLMYGDHEGGQRTIARFGVTVEEAGAARSANVIRYWSVDYEDPRRRDG
jgi:hypothetical protein